jgi:hypothetical protein
MCSNLFNARLRLESKRPEIREMVLGDRALLPDSVHATISPDVRRAIFGDPEAACLKVGDVQCEAITAVLGYLYPKVVVRREGGPPDHLTLHCVAPNCGPDVLASERPDPKYSSKILPVILDDIQFLRYTTSPDQVEAIVDILVEAFPLFVAKLKDRQPHFVPGGKYSLLTPESAPQAAHSRVTTDTQEGDHGIGDHFLTHGHSTRDHRHHGKGPSEQGHGVVSQATRRAPTRALGGHWSNRASQPG